MPECLQLLFAHCSDAYPKLSFLMFTAKGHCYLTHHNATLCSWFIVIFLNATSHLLSNLKWKENYPPYYQYLSKLCHCSGSQLITACISLIIITSICTKTLYSVRRANKLYTFNYLWLSLATEQAASTPLTLTFTPCTYRKEIRPVADKQLE